VSLEYLGYGIYGYQHPPTISCGGAKMESDKQWEMDEETLRHYAEEEDQSFRTFLTSDLFFLLISGLLV